MGSIDFSMTSTLIAGARVCKQWISHLAMDRIATSYRYSEAGGHSVEIIWVLAHSHHFGNDGLASPLDPKDLCKLFEVLCCCFSDREDRVPEPAHA